MGLHARILFTAAQKAELWERWKNGQAGHRDLGTVRVIAAGEKADRAAAKSLRAGSFFHMPAGTAHYAWAESESVVQVSGMRPFDVVYIDPKDDPRKK